MGVGIIAVIPGVPAGNPNPNPNPEELSCMNGLTTGVKDGPTAPTLPFGVTLPTPPTGAPPEGSPNDKVEVLNGELGAKGFASGRGDISACG